VIVGNVQVYLLEIDVTPTALELVGTQSTKTPVGPVIVQLVDPAGCGLPFGPVTVAVKVFVPPKMGEEEETRDTVGVVVETPRLTAWELEAR
jgi:hypothetical protein